MVTTSRDSSRAARVLKRAVMVGLNAAGCNVEDLEAATVPLTRFQIRTSPSCGGVTVRLVSGDPQSVSLRFLDVDGVDLDEATERKVERLYEREESRRVLAAEIGDIDFPSRTVESYTLDLTGTVDLVAIREAGFKLVLDYAFGTTSFVMPNVLAKLGADVLAINPHVSTPGVLSYERQSPRRAAGRPGAVLGGSSRGDVRAGRRAVDARRRHRADPHRRGGALCDGRPRHEGAPGLLDRRAGRRAVRGEPPGGGGLERGRVDQARPVRPDGGMCQARESASAGTPRAASSSRSSSPPSMPSRPSSTSSRCSPTTGRRLSEVVGALRSPHVVRREVPTPFEHKGLVMRTLLERATADEVVLVDGVKLVDPQGWTLVVPDPEAPLTLVTAEGETAELAEARAQQMAEQVGWIVAEATG